MFDQWKFQDFDPGEGRKTGVYHLEYDDSGWMPISVPGDIHRALMDAGRIPDPFYDQNENLVQWVEGREWWYRVTFDAPGGLGAADERHILVLKGLDTYAVLYLNGALLGRHQNMFREAVFDVSAKLKPGKNQLAIRFDPPLSKIDPNHPFKSWWGRNPERVFMRKAQFGFGWDWGPRLPTIGLWQPVELVRMRSAGLLGVHFATLRIDWKVEQKLNVRRSRDAAQALVMVRVEASRFHGDEPLKAEIRLGIPGEKKPVVEETIMLDNPGSLQDRVVYLTVPEPQLWWTYDQGTPFLYELRVRLRKGKDILDSYREMVGIRTLALDQSPDPDEPGTRFFRFVLNGEPFFARGANWIPADSFVGAIEPQQYERLLIMARDANMNMLRVWGGGIYEPDVFYHLCDRLGLLVWQDFMFACAMYPEYDSLANEVDMEARYQVRRLRSHPSLALWCGNNENQWIHDRNNATQSGEIVPGSRYYDEILPNAVADLDGVTPYWPGSPYGGNDYNSMDDGDRHNWHVWHGGQPRRFGEPLVTDRSPEGVSFRHYAEDMGRFISEFGMHAAPVLETLRRSIPPDMLFHHSPSMDHHNKDTPKNKGDHLMQTVTGLPKDLGEYIDFSMLSQAEGLKFGIEHFRRRWPHCAGALIWQLNDCWPVLSWSLIDYYGFGKAGYYYTRRVFSPVLASFKEYDDGRVGLWVTNDLREDFQDHLAVKLATFNGEVIWEKNIDVTILAKTSIEVMVWDEHEVSPSPDRYLVVRSVDQKFPKNRLFFKPIKDLHRQPARPEMTATQVDELIVSVELKASTYVIFAHLTHPDPDTQFSDNYFDLEPGETRHIWIGNPIRPIQAGQFELGWR